MMTRRTSQSILPIYLSILLVCCAGQRARASEIDFRAAVVVTPANLSRQEHHAIQLLVEEVEKRTLVKWPVMHAWPSESTPVIAIGPLADLDKFAGPLGQQPGPNPGTKNSEGFTLRVVKEGRIAPVVLVIGHDARGVLFGAGRLLRELHMARGAVAVSDALNLSTSPTYPIRGHQLGYRPKTNSYDGWNLAIWEQYIRDLAVFGTNAVELIPPRSDDAADSPHFPLPPMDMMVGMSKLLDDYGLDVWIWYPAMDRDYGNPKTVEFAVHEWGEVFKKLPRVDAVFVPGGDPGHTRPRILFNLLEKQTENLHRYHPKAQMWVSPQSFTKEWLDEFLEIMQKEQPSWLNGVVYGPQVRISLPELRKAIPAKYPIRRYPDITHSMRCQYPVPDWDLAFALTEAREVINPRPVGQAQIFHAFAESSVGFITYSEGCNDDVNKMVWSGLGWDPSANVPDLLRQYGRYFMGDRYADDFAQGLLALEKNWQGPLLTNEAVYTTLKQFQDLERSASPAVRLNWRFQQALYRAYYDAYQRSRLIDETALEEQAMNKLRAARTLGSLAAMRDAESILEQAESRRVSSDWRARVFELAEALFQSIRMQLSVERYQAIDIGRGANLDTIDVPLNNRGWLRQRFTEIRQLGGEPDRLNEIAGILNWCDPGPGGFYDDLGNPSRQPHLVPGLEFAKDPARLFSAMTGFANAPNWRRSWCTSAESLYETPLKLCYKDLDHDAQYKVRIVYAGDSRARIRLVANDDVEIHPLMAKEYPPRPVEFAIPREKTQGGKLTLTWNQDPGKGGGGRGCQVAEVWLIKK
jgi:hypothetical protein